MPGKKAKKAKLTEEERLLMRQRNMQAEEELRKKKERLMFRVIKERLAREEHNARVSRLKLHQQWRTILRQAKTEELRKDIIILSQTFERVADHKSSVIEALVQDLEEVEEQHAMAFRSHMNNLQRLIALQNDPIHTLQKGFQEEKDTFMETYNAEWNEVMERHQMEMAHLKDISNLMKIKFEDEENKKKQEYWAIQHETRKKNMEGKGTLRMELEGRVEELWGQFQQAHKTYQEDTEERRAAYEMLKVRNEKRARKIELQTKNLHHTQEMINGLRTRLAVSASESVNELQQPREKKRVIMKEVLETKSKIKEARELERSKLTTLTLQSNVAVKQLRNTLNKGERLLKLAEMCHKLQTEEEHVLPIFVPSLSSNVEHQEQEKQEEQVEQKDQQEQQEQQQEEQEEEEERSAQPAEKIAETMDNYRCLQRFWRRYNKVQLDIQGRERERAALLKLNENLRSQLQRYLDDMCVSDRALHQDNPMLVLNQRSGVPPTQALGRKVPRVVIEAAHIVKHII
uniref:dynein regulatory complex subunit 2-like n=1 Tax=Myxine glutinosa TaxID=7769 RepID=UPI00358FC5C5